MSKYTTLLFDADDTIFDFAAAEKSALKDAMIKNGLPYSDALHLMYSKINQSYWQAFERGEIRKKDIYLGRFVTFLEKTGLSCNLQSLGSDYESSLGKYHYFIDGAYEMCLRLKEKYRLYIVTNGMKQVQERRIKESGLDGIISGMFISEAVGVPKPEKKYFDYVFDNIKEKDKSKILIIGDSQTSDISGGVNAGIDTCWYNPSGTKVKIVPTYEVENYAQLEEILK